jgi:iron complex transport system substrate-binding protein
MKYLNKILIVAMFLFTLTACSTQESEPIQSQANQPQQSLPTVDRAGNPVEIPKDAQRVISFAPSITQVIDEIGLRDKLVAVDSQSPNYVKGVDELPQFDMMTPDLEALAALEPDIMFVSGMSSANDLESSLIKLALTE